MRASERREVRRGGSAGVLVPMLVVACGGGQAKPTPAPSPVPTTPAPRPPETTRPAPSTGAAGAPSEAALGRFTYAPGTSRYEVRTDATVELAGSRERETVGTSARVIYTVARGTRAGTATMTGAVDSIAVQASARVSAGAADARAAVIPFRATVDGTTRGTSAPGATRVELVDGVPRCALPEGGAQGAALVAARETVLRVPAVIPVGTRWRDSVTTPGCSGEIPTTVTVVARYEVVGGARYGGADGVRVRRETTTTWRGQGIARGRQVIVVGSGAGEGSVYLDPVGGRVLGAEGETRATVRVTGGRDPAQEFTQQTRVRVRLLP